ncbi:MAG: endonuclease MutS2 [Oscillospiraceae bacterium]|nr:endonuclease MutS2 [Oscillospiraceae bacterium]
MNSNHKTLELHKILAMLSEKASNPITKEKALSIKPSSDFETVKKELSKTSDAYELSCKFGNPPFYNFKDISDCLNRASSDGKLSLKEMLDVRYLLMQCREISEWYSQCSETENTLSYLFSSVVPNKSLEKRIELSVLSEEELADTASDELEKIRKKIIRSGMKVREHLDKMIKSSSVQKSLQENIVTIRDGRYVLPVKAEHKNNVEGLVHDVSSSGSTLFIEPMAVVEENNNIRVLKALEQEEIERIIKEISAECGAFAEQLIRNMSYIAELNLYFSKADLGIEMRGSVASITDSGKVILKKARHPLIDKNKVVPISLSLGEDYNVLIITGPNTGGKTVSLKTVGLLTLMTMCGLMIPAEEGSVITVFKDVLVDIGDEQSIEQSLSTFSSHMNRVADILKKSDKDTLVLLDELGSGTDPVEGSALAVSIIESLKNKGTKLMVTTHYQDIKLYALDTPNVENASCEFDISTLRPTYKLIIGSPGKSNAFAISSKLGIPDDIIEYAKSLVTEENKRFENIFENLEKLRSELESNNEKAEKLREELEIKTKEINEKQKLIDDNYEKELENARIKAMHIVENVQERSDELLDELAEIRKQKDKSNFSALTVDAKSKAKSALNDMYKQANPVVKKTDDYKLPRPLKRGDTVYITDIDKNGIVAGEVDGSGNVFVQTGIMKTKVNISKLRLVEAQKPAQNKSKGVSKKGIQSKVTRKVELELDIRGQAADEGVFEVQRFIDSAVMSGVKMVTVIHGKGTGILRNAVHKELKSNSSVKTFRLGIYGEGEDGVTIVELK